MELDGKIDTKDQLRRTLIRHEGLKLKPYVDTMGKLTIGVGRNLTDVGISELEALMLLNNDIGIAQANLISTFPFYQNLNQARKDVLTMMCFQLGLGGLIKFPKMLGALAEGKYTQASAEMLNSVWHEQTPKRCEELAQIILSGQYKVT